MHRFGIFDTILPCGMKIRKYHTGIQFMSIIAVHSCPLLHNSFTCSGWRCGLPKYQAFYYDNHIIMVCICFPTPGRGLPYGSGLGLSRCLGPGECLHSLIHNHNNSRYGIDKMIMQWLTFYSYNITLFKRICLHGTK